MPGDRRPRGLNQGRRGSSHRLTARPIVRERHAAGPARNYLKMLTALAATEEDGHRSTGPTRRASGTSPSGSTASRRSAEGDRVGEGDVHVVEQIADTSRVLRAAGFSCCGNWKSGGGGSGCRLRTGPPRSKPQYQSPKAITFVLHTVTALSRSWPPLCSWPLTSEAITARQQKGIREATTPSRASATVRAAAGAARAGRRGRSTPAEAAGAPRVRPA